MFAIVEIGGVPEAITMSDYFLGTSAFWQSVLTTSAVEGRADLARSRLQVGKWPRRIWAIGSACSFRERWAP
jgi:hypothetical protein